ncbi:MAG: polysaccharide deacetylase family protein [Clostridia bacterium]|nr:polysaccharide deacetylase family protein [Clostridia bacterium]
MVKERTFRHIVVNAVIAALVVSVAVAGIVLNNKAVSVNEPAPLYRGTSDTKVSLMINVYWGTEYIEPMLDILKRKGVKTTFFVGGMWVAENDALLKKIYDEGHEIGNHGYYHKDSKKLSDERCAQEISVTHKLVSEIVGVEMDLFAPPSGSYGSSTVNVAEKLGYRTILWSLDTIDWRDKDAELIYSRATKKIRGGDLVLMHPTEKTVDALERIIDEISAKGLTVSTVSEVLGD